MGRKNNGRKNGEEQRIGKRRQGCRKYGKGEGMGGRTGRRKKRGERADGEGRSGDGVTHCKCWQQYGAPNDNLLTAAARPADLE